MTLIEYLVRTGSQDWTCARSIANQTEMIFKLIVIPNLIWRVGRVESTMRKVSLAIGYALLKAGAVGIETLLKCATEFAPLLVC